MAPSTANGATILLRRKAATNVIVFQYPHGACPINSTPRGLRPLSRTILVVTAVSSINTSRAGSSMPCSRIQRLRARATSARCCSAARRLFFKGDVVPLETPRDCTLTRSYPLLAQFHDDLVQGQVWLIDYDGQYLFGVPFQGGNASAARLGRATSSFVPALQPPDGRTRVNIKAFGRLPSRSSCFHRVDHTLAQVTRIGFRHCPLPQGESMQEESLTATPLGIPPIQIGRETL